jgi:DNA-binding response OmpR family regulator
LSDPTKHSSHAANGLRILIVEDEPVTSQAMKRFLEFKGHEVSTAANGEEALQESQNLKPDIVVSDWKLEGDEDGLDVVAQLQSERDPTIIMVTAHRLDRVRDRSRALGLKVAAFRRKPISLASLASLVEEVAAHRAG